MTDPLLFPHPQEVEILGLGPRVEDLAVVVQRDPARPAESFELDVDERGARVTAADDRAERHARAVLAQLRDQPSEGRIRSVHLRDWPDIPTRGAMLDVSRDRVPTRSTLERLVDLLALARFNQLQLYLEHAFAYRDHREVWQHADPLTPADIRWLDRLCTERGIELVANQNCFGHFGRWLALDRYRSRAEAPDGVDVALGVHLEPTVLAPTQANADFALALVEELLECFSSRKVNIGCDETFELGRGVSAAECAARGTGRVYVDHLRRLTGPLVDRGYEVQVWADVLRSHPHLAGELAEEVVPIAWAYEAPVPEGDRFVAPAALQPLLDDLGMDLDGFYGFEANLGPLAEAGIHAWVAPGTSAWNSLVGRVDNALANQIDAAEAARRHGAGGFLVTDWGDGGHLQPPSVSFGPLVHAGAVAWAVDANRRLDVAEVLDRLVFDDPTGRLGSTLDDVGRVWSATGQVAVNASPLQSSLLPHQPHLVAGRPDPAAVHEVLDRLEVAATAIAAARPGCADGPLVQEELTQAVRLARHGAWRLLQPADGRPTDDALRADLVEAIDGQRSAWLGRSREGGLADSLGHLRRTLALYPDGPATDDSR